VIGKEKRVRKIKIKIEMLFWAFLTYPKRILDFR
jgi:hypothetical protein